MASDPQFGSLEAELRDTLAPGIQLLRPLGQGGMGWVFLARDPALKRQVVVKVLAPALARDQNARMRFHREAEASAALSHPNVVRVYQIGELPRSATGYFIMEYVDGPTLTEELGEGKELQEGRAKRIVGEVASALASAHARGVVHRDIKPSNVMLERESGRARVLDFGISAVVGGDAASRSTKLTAEGTSIGTPQYMSPEQAAGEEVTDRTDCYSLGLVAFELLTGRPPFRADNAMALIAAHIKDTPPKVHDLRPDVETHVAELIDTCLEKAPIARPTAESVAHALLPAAGAVVEWPPPGLEPLSGMGRAFLKRLTWFAVGEYVFASLLGSSLASDVTATVFGLGSAIGFFLTGFAIHTAVKAWRLPAHVRRAYRAGYPLRVIIDVAIDGVPDTELLLNRMGPFARLQAEDSLRFLQGRRRAFVTWTASVVVALLAPVIAVVSGMPGILLLVPPVLIGAYLTLPLFTRAETRFRKRFATPRTSPRGSPASREIVDAWLKSAGESRAHARLRAWLAQIGAATFHGLLLVILLTGVIAFNNFSVLSWEYEYDPPGNPSSHLDSLRRAQSAASSSIPDLWITANAGTVDQPPSDLSPLVTRLIWLRARSRRLRLEGFAWRMVQDALPDSIETTLEAAAQLDELRLWRTLGHAALLTGWYVEALDVAQISDSSTPLPRRSTQSNLRSLPLHSEPLRGIWEFAHLNAAAAALHLSRGERDQAIDRTAETINVGLSLARDPLTIDAAVRVLGTGLQMTNFLEQTGEDPRLIADAQALERFTGDLLLATDAFNSNVAAKASTQPVRSVRNEILMLVSSREIRPAHRLGLARGVALGACYSGMEIFFGVRSARERLMEDVWERIADLDEANFFRNVLPEAHFPISHRPGWRGWLDRLSWVDARERACERNGALTIVERTGPSSFTVHQQAKPQSARTIGPNW